MSPAALGLTGVIVTAVLAGITGIVVGLLRLARRSPESREQETSAFDRLTTKQAEWIDRVEKRVGELETRLNTEIAARERAEARATRAEERADRAEKRAENLEQRVTQFEVVLRAHRIEIPPVSLVRPPRPDDPH